ncbi:ATR-interacting protein, partial [Sphaeramia orbicularis]|uniref:ATR-interacting protein n=1 Tax=Sphaeramia orbicularis TaxID=375764 RepID=UPI00117D6212
MNYPPTKRLRGLNHDVAANFDDPFGDDEDFSQAELDEIDIIASQAITSATAGGAGQGSRAGGQNKPPSRAPANQSRGNGFGFNNKGNSGIPSREPLGNRQQQFTSDRQDYGLLETQHVELKRKLKEVEEEILLKNGEIRVLRDSLKTAQQEKEAQRQNQALVETQRLREQSEKEKELSRKVQSLQSELQFKEAEINEMKSKLHSSDKKNSSPLARNSPKVLSSVAQLHHGSSGSSSSPSGSGFITKETFGAQVVSRTTPVKTSTKTRRDGSSRSADKQEVSRPDPFLSVRRPNLQHRGGALLGLLLQQPLFPSSLGLSHLLSLSLTDAHRTSRLSAAATSSGHVVIGGGRASGTVLSPVQSLAMTGLNLLSQSDRSSSSCSSCPGSVLLLPLLQLHLSQLCHTLDSLHSTASIPACRGASPEVGGLEDAGQTGFSVDDSGLAALRILYLLLTHSDEVVQEVLTEGSQRRAADKKVEGSAADVDPKSQSSLLQCVLRLCDAGVSLKEELICNAMKTLSVLIERTPKTDADKLQCVLQQVCVCVSADSSLAIISQCVSVLLSMSDHQTLTHQLCSQHDPCVFLKLFQFIRSRPDQKACHTDWILLDLQVIRLLSRLWSHTADRWSQQRSSCHCHTE